MEHDRWQRLWSVFHGALERPDGEVRAEFLAGTCGRDAELRAEIDALLAAHAATEGPFAQRAAEEAVPVPPDAVPGDLVGTYRILRPIGEGGMGVVFEALQEAPIRRRVALKLIKLGMDTREVVRRFEAERQALARMDHTSIARVFEAGATAAGRPYFAMELVEGTTITEYCDARSLPIARRLELVAEVCRAVHHAHQKGVIHRDLKAGNVLVATQEGRPVPKVIDFGIARAVETEPGAEKRFTRHGHLVGTPETMSPEQAAMSVDLDTRTDIYSLGALLYELLSGALPFEVHDTPFAELLRRIREVEPAAPSARVAQLGAEAVPVASRRSTDLLRLRRELRGDLDWIVARAMAKERDRRYGSAAELADDLERHLAHRPVVAGPPSGLYRLRKLVRRHRVEAAAAAALLAALIGFGATMALQSERLARALDLQERERTTASRVSEFLVALLEQPDPALARGEEVTVRQVLDRGAERVARDLADQPEIQARLLETIGRVYLNLGLFESAAPALERALELRRRLRGPEHVEVAAALHKLGELEFARARYERARALAEAALAMRRRLLGGEDLAVAESLDLVALLDRQAGDLGGAERRHEHALAIKRAAVGDASPAVAESWNYLGIVRRWRGDYAGAEAAYRTALSIWREALGGDHPQVAMAMNNLALVLHVGGDYRAARSLFEELIPLRRRILGPAHPDLEVTLANYGKLLHDLRDLEASARVYEEAVRIGRLALGEDHPQLAGALADYGAVLAKLGRFDAALAAEQRALAIRRAVYGPRHATVAASLGYLAQVRAARGERRAAERLFTEAVELLRQTGGEPLRTAEALQAHGRFLLESGEAERALGRTAEAVSLLRAALPAGDRRIARAESLLGACWVLEGNLAEAEALLVGSLAVLSRSESPEAEEARARLADLRAAQARARRPSEATGGG